MPFMLAPGDIPPPASAAPCLLGADSSRVFGSSPHSAPPELAPPSSSGVPRASGPTELNVLDALPLGVVVVSAEGSVEYANAWAAKVLRQPLGRVVGANATDLFGTTALLFGSLLEKPESARHEASIRIGSEDVALGISVSPLDDPQTGRRLRVVIFQEISQFLELRRQRDKLLQLAALGEALPSVLHELRNPLAAVRAMLEVLIEESSGRLQEDLYSILGEVRRMNLGLSGIGALVRTLDSDSYNAIDFAVREACRVLEPAAARKGIKLAADGDDLPLLPLNREVVSGVVFNLVNNAIDACSEGGEIHVTARLDGPSVFELEVRDTGAGMSESVLANCFELFFTTKEKGSGIGLALCRRIAESSGGVLSAESRVGEGTTITLRTPLKGSSH